METLGLEASQRLKLTVELASVAVVGAGFLAVLLSLGLSVFARRPVGFDVERLRLARYLALALELQLGADIIGTAISPGWEQIAALGAIAVIRTSLNFFLSREIKEETSLLREEETRSLVAEATETAGAA